MCVVLISTKHNFFIPVHYSTRCVSPLRLVEVGYVTHKGTVVYNTTHTSPSLCGVESPIENLELPGLCQ